MGRRVSEILPLPHLASLHPGKHKGVVSCVLPSSPEGQARTLPGEGQEAEFHLVLAWDTPKQTVFSQKLHPLTFASPGLNIVLRVLSPS